MPTVAILSFPSAYIGADRLAVRSQRLAVRLTIAELALVVLGGITGLLGGALVQSSQDRRIPLLIGAGLFFAAFALRAFRTVIHPDRSWHDGRAVAESIKTLSWSYAVGGDPFPITLAGAAADGLFVDRLRGVIGNVEVDLHDDGPQRPQITEELRGVRRLSLPERQEIYEQLRIADQQDWYAAKAAANARASLRWNLGLLVLEIGAAGVAFGGLLQLSGEIGAQGLGIGAALVAAVAAWIQARQFTSLSASYGLAAHELGAIRVLLAHQLTEVEWAAFVNDAETAISREHTMWRASRS